MVIFPAIDLRRGRCVRLRQGDPSAETVFGDDPAAVAAQWSRLGAQWLHVVNLDGALGDQGPDAANLRCLAEIRRAVAVPIQFGGGLRTLEDVAWALDLGVDRVVLGTAAMRQPDLVVEGLRRFGPERIVVSLDARNGQVATHGWQASSGQDVVAAGQRFHALGVVLALFTDIARDGLLVGLNVEATADLARRSGLRVIASGGACDLDDIRRLRAVADAGIEGVVIGQALYTGQIDLAEAIALSREQ